MIGVGVGIDEGVVQEKVKAFMAVVVVMVVVEVGGIDQVNANEAECQVRIERDSGRAGLNEFSSRGAKRLSAHLHQLLKTLIAC